jgi:ACS family hexuronate transporter-like MFS transporter
VRSPIPARWVAITIFVFSAVLNYLDRQVLATMVDIWRTRPDFPFTYDDYGKLLTVFSIAYALSALFIGWFIDRVGLNRGATISVAVWAIASIGTGMSNSVDQLLFWRALLGVAEASGVSAVGKAVGLYLLPKERAVGSAMGQLGLSLGAGLAPRFAVFFSYEHSWRWAFFAAAILSFAWIPVWIITSRIIRPTVAPSTEKAKHAFGLLADPKLWALIIANFLSMTIYSLWTNWPPTYLIKVHHLTPTQAANYTWFVPLCGYLGALMGGSMSWRFIRQGMTPVGSRKRVCLIAAVLLIGTVGIPFLPTPLLATLGMSVSFFLIAAWSANHYTLPIDIYGHERAAFGVGSLIFAYGAMQSVISRPLAQVIQEHGFKPVCFTVALLPILAYLLVHFLIPDNSDGSLGAGSDLMPGGSLGAGSDLMPGGRLGTGSDLMPGGSLGAGSDLMPGGRLGAGSDLMPGGSLGAGSDFRRTKSQV